MPAEMKPGGGSAEAEIQSPQAAPTQPRRREQVDIDPSDFGPEQPVQVQKGENFIVIGRNGGGQQPKVIQNLGA